RHAALRRTPSRSSARRHAPPFPAEGNSAGPLRTRAWCWALFSACSGAFLTICPLWYHGRLPEHKISACPLRQGSGEAHVLEVVLVEAEIVADLVEHRGLHLHAQRLGIRRIGQEVGGVKDDARG